MNDFPLTDFPVSLNWDQDHTQACRYRVVLFVFTKRSCLFGKVQSPRVDLHLESFPCDILDWVTCVIISGPTCARHANIKSSPTAQNIRVLPAANQTATGWSFKHSDQYNLVHTVELGNSFFQSINGLTFHCRLQGTVPLKNGKTIRKRVTQGSTS